MKQRVVEIDTELWVNDKPIPVMVRATVTPGDPGRYTGKPEDCYPAEPAEVDCIELFYEGEVIGGALGDALAATLDMDEEILTKADEDAADEEAEAADLAFRERREGE